MAALHPGFAPAHIALQQALERQGRYPAALEADPLPAAEVGRALARGGASGYSALLLRLTERGWPAPVTPAHRANMHAARGEHERALEWLERAYADRDDELVWAGVEPWYEPLRGEARFADLLQRMGLAAAVAR